jgi:hypothetical protein
MVLKNLQDILDRASGKEAETFEDDLRSTVRALWDRQFVYADDHAGARPYDIAKRHRTYFESLFDAMGFDLILDEREFVVGIVDQAGASPRSMRIDETLFLLALRIVYSERISTFALKERGRCDTTLGEVWTLIEDRAQRKRPSVTRCLEIARRFQRHGLVKALDDNGHDAGLEIRPAIRHAMNEASLDSLLRYAQAGGNLEVSLDRDAADEPADDDNLNLPDDGSAKD